jgi:hypothetical protein
MLSRSNDRRRLVRCVSCPMAASAPHPAAGSRKSHLQLCTTCCYRFPLVTRLPLVTDMLFKHCTAGCECMKSQVDSTAAMQHDNLALVMSHHASCASACSSCMAAAMQPGRQHAMQHEQGATLQKFTCHHSRNKGQRPKRHAGCRQRSNAAAGYTPVVNPCSSNTETILYFRVCQV